MLKETVSKHFKINPFFASIVLGHISAYGMGPYYIWPIFLICLSLYWITLTSLSDQKPWKSAFSGLLFGFGFFVSSLWWIGNALLIGGNDFKWAYPFAAAGLPMLLSLFPMLSTYLIRRIAAGRSLKSYFSFLILIFMAEFIRGTCFTGFPWNLSGMTWTNNLSMLQFLSIGGVYGLTFITLFMFTAPAFAMKGDASRIKRLSVILFAIVTSLSLYQYGHKRLSSNPTTYNNDVVVQMIQPNIKQEDKWNGEKRWDNFRETTKLMDQVDRWAEAKTRVIVFPETTLTYHDFNEPDAINHLKGKMSGYSEKNIYLLSGVLLRDDAGYHNSLVAFDKDMNFLESFDKFHLVPFGEYIPFQKYIPITTITQFSGFVEGEGPRTLSLDNLPSFSPLVCYEVIFPNAVTSKNRPDWMVNVTNDAWYGVSPGPYQHFAQAQYRAIEEGLPMVRVAQTGISAIIDPYGRVTAVSGLNNAGNVEGLLPSPAPETIFKKTMLLFQE